MDKVQKIHVRTHRHTHAHAELHTLNCTRTKEDTARGDKEIYIQALIIKHHKELVGRGRRSAPDDRQGTALEIRLRRRPRLLWVHRSILGQPCCFNLVTTHCVEENRGREPPTIRKMDQNTDGCLTECMIPGAIQRDLIIGKRNGSAERQEGPASGRKGCSQGTPTSTGKQSENVRARPG